MNILPTLLVTCNLKEIFILVNEIRIGSEFNIYFVFKDEEIKPDAKTRLFID